MDDHEGVSLSFKYRNIINLIEFVEINLSDLISKKY